MGVMLYFFFVPLSEGQQGVKSSSTRAKSQFFEGKGCLFHHHHKLGKEALHVKDDEAKEGDPFSFSLIALSQAKVSEDSLERGQAE